jgi:CBS domain containing-hemolysin-like protein
MLGSLWIYRPFGIVLNASGRVLLRMLGAPLPAHRHIHSPEEIELLIAESRDGGLLEPDEHRRLQRALRLNLKQAKQLMVPRTKIAALDVNMPLHEAISIMAQSPYSRLPVYRESLDNIIGVLHTKDLVRWFVSETPTATLEKLMRVVPTVHESVTADRMLRELRERRSHQALVVDEFGGTSGLLTLEDVLSELLGQVGDEFKGGEPVVERLPMAARVWRARWQSTTQLRLSPRSSRPTPQPWRDGHRSARPSSDARRNCDHRRVRVHGRTGQRSRPRNGARGPAQARTR